MFYSAFFIIIIACKLQKMNQNMLKKMLVKSGDLVTYYLELNDQKYDMNSLIGHHIKFRWHGEVICLCGNHYKKFYRSGFCYKCYWEAPQASQSIFKPELCTAHLDIEERDLEWEKKFQLAPHYVYLANSSGIKVGITRSTQGVVRWIDQGASQAIILAKVPNRRLSGDIEIILKQFVSDKTNWRRMLSGVPDALDLVSMKQDLSLHIPSHLQEYIVPDDTVTEINYPVNEYPIKIKSLKLDEKSNIIEGELKGIKGQYLLFDQGRVFNVRSHEGYIVDFSHSNLLKQGVLF